MRQRKILVQINEIDVLDLITLVNGIESAFVLGNYDIEQDNTTERIHCSNCGKSVSTPVPLGTLVRAFIQCPECIEKEDEEPMHEEWGTEAERCSLPFEEEDEEP